jgi:hypothetical protein
VYAAGAEDEHGNIEPTWADPVTVACFWWSPSSAEPSSAPTGGDRVTADVVLVVDSAVAVDHRDRFTVDGKRFEVIGLPADYDHGPFGFAPNRRVIDLKWVG